MRNGKVEVQKGGTAQEVKLDPLPAKRAEPLPT